MLLNLFLLIAFLCAIFYLYLKLFVYTYWAKKKVQYIPPRFPLGNAKIFLPRGIGIGPSSFEFYQYFKKLGVKFGGTYAIHQPQLVLIDPGYVRDILITDFQHFTDRGIYSNKEDDPLNHNIFAQDGSEWKKIRTLSSPTFSVTKLKAMIPLIKTCADNLVARIDSEIKNECDIDILEVVACFFNDVTGTCIFGIECNSLENPDDVFRQMGRRVFNDYNLRLHIELFLSIYTPNLARKLGVRNLQKDVSDYFYQCIVDVVKKREELKITRPDLLESLIKMMNADEESERFSMMDVASQAFLYFLAGFETSSKTVTFTLFELSKNTEAQSRARKEILEVLQRSNGEITYESLAEMKYLEQIVSETLRLYPVLTTIQRKCTKDYQLRDTNVLVEKGTWIVIPVLGLHRDPDYFPEPEKWDPERFSPETKHSIVPCSYLPFGDGPRNCIGLRLGQIQSKIALVYILKNFEIIRCHRTSEKLSFNPDTFVTAATETVYVKIKRIQ